MFISYAQNFEDVILRRALKDVEKGFYIDIGAQDPVVDSVSLAFYQQGWRGVHVEPSSAYAEALRKARPDEVVAETLVSDAQGNVQFFEIAATGLSTANLDFAVQHAAKGYQINSKSVVSVRLETILDTYRDRDIHWLKIDVEGEELSVVRSWRHSVVRPWIVVVECVDPFSHKDTSAKWEPDLIALGYIFAYADGLNRFYVSEAHPELAKALTNGPNVFDGFALSGTSSAPFSSVLTSQLAALSGQLSEHSEYEAGLEKRIAVLQAETKRREIEHVGREADLQAQIAALQVKIRRSEAEYAAKETDLRAQLAVRMSELARLGEVIGEQNRWGENMMRQVGMLSTQIFDVHCSTSWRITGPLRRISRVVRKCGSALLRTSGILLRQSAMLLRDHAPRFYDALAATKLLRMVYLRVTRPKPTGNVIPQPMPLNAIAVEPSPSGAFMIFQQGHEISTQGQFVNSMARWRKGKRVYG